MIGKAQNTPEISMKSKRFGGGGGIRTSRTTPTPSQNEADLPKSRVYLFQHPRPGTQLLLAELVERGLHGIEVGVEVFGVGVEVQQASDDFAFRRVVGDVFERLYAVGRVVLGVGLAQADDGAVVLRYFDRVAFVVFD